MFFDAAARARAEAAVRSRYGVDAGRRVVLYAPTFRGAGPRDARDPGLLDVARLHATLGDGWVLLLRLHPLVATAASLPPGTRVRRRRLGLAGHERLLLVADVLVTDYSSVMFEFALLERPMAFLAPDADAYTAERGFYLDLRTDLPGPAFATTADLATHLASGSFDVERTRAFARRWFDVADGRAAARFVDRVVLPALRGEPVAVPPVPPPDERVVAPPAPGA